MHLLSQEQVRKHEMTSHSVFQSKRLEPKVITLIMKVYDRLWHYFEDLF